jgi:hypothetical protein
LWLLYPIYGKPADGSRPEKQLPKTDGGHKIFEKNKMRTKHSFLTSTLTMRTTNVSVPSKATTKTQAVSTTKNRRQRWKSMWAKTKMNEFELQDAFCVQEVEAEASAQQAACFERTREDNVYSSKEVKEISEERAEASAQDIFSVEGSRDAEMITSKETRKPVIISGLFCGVSQMTQKTSDMDLKEPDSKLVISFKEIGEKVYSEAATTYLLSAKNTCTQEVSAQESETIPKENILLIEEVEEASDQVAGPSSSVQPSEEAEKASNEVDEPSLSAQPSEEEVEEAFDVAKSSSSAQEDGLEEVEEASSDVAEPSSSTLNDNAADENARHVTHAKGQTEKTDGILASEETENKMMILFKETIENSSSETTADTFLAAENHIGDSRDMLMESIENTMDRIADASTHYLPLCCVYHTDEQQDDLLSQWDSTYYSSTFDNESVDYEDRSELDCTRFEHRTVEDEQDRTDVSHDSHTIEDEERDSSSAEKVELVAIENKHLSFEGPSEISLDNNSEDVNEMQKCVAQINTIERTMNRLNRAKNNENEEEMDSTAGKVEFAIENEHLCFDGPSGIFLDSIKVPLNKNIKIWPNNDGMDIEAVYEMQKLVAQIDNIERTMNRLNRAKKNENRRRKIRGFFAKFSENPAVE